MKKVVLLIGALMCCAAAYGRPAFLEPTRELRIPGLDFRQVDVDGDWILARGIYITNVDPNDPDWSFDWWEKVVLFRRSSSGQWQLVQTLADEYLIFNSDEHWADPHDLVLENGIAAFSTNSGLHVFELVSGTWVRRSVVGGPSTPPFDLAFDGVTLLAWDGSCGTSATAYTRLADGRWSAQGELVGLPECEEFYQRRLAVSGSRALVFEDGPYNGGLNDAVRVFQRSGSAWLPGMTLPPPPPPPFGMFGPEIALRGDVAMVSGDGTNLYRRDASGFNYIGKIPLLVSALEWPYAAHLAIGSTFALQSYPGPSTYRDIAVLRANSSGNYDHVATMARAYETESLSIHARRVVSAAGGAVQVYDIPQTLTPATATYHDFENGSAGWTALSGQFAVARRGPTYVYRQSSLTGDAVAVNSVNLKTTLITADVRATQFEGDTRWVGLMARFVDENNMYYVAMRGNNSISIRKKVNGVITDLRTFWPQFVVGRNYRVAFEVTGNRLRFYFGEYVIDAADPENSLPQGRAGVRTYRATADFDNVIITPVPLLELGGGPRMADISMFDVVDGSWTVGGVFELHQSSTSGNARILHGPATDDQVISVAARLTSIGTTTTGSHWIGAMVRYTDPSNYYYVSLRTSNELSLRKVVNGVVTELARVPFTLQLNQRYRIRFEAIGTKLMVYLNDSVRLQATDASLAQGRTGVVTYRAGALFTNYTVWQP